MWKNDYFRNFAYAALGVITLLIVVVLFLTIYTRHGQSQPVPDFNGMTINEVQKLAKKEGLRIEITDSIFRQALRPGGVIDQNPKAGALVKKNRKVFVVINCITPKTIDAPDVVGFSLRQGKSVLESRGLKVGRLIYKPDMATNNIIGQQRKGGTLRAGDAVYVGSEVDLVLGLNSESMEQTAIPSVLRLNYDNARSRLADASLNVGRVQFDKSVETLADSLAAFVYRQSPGATNSAETSLGSSVDLYLSVDQSKLPK